MEKRLKDYLAFLKNLPLSGSGEATMEATEREHILKDLLIQISFFQHERFIHLIVTVLFALMTTAVMLGIVVAFQPILVLLMLVLLVLLIPYIRHYYILENGVQLLYTYYDLLKRE